MLSSKGRILTIISVISLIFSIGAAHADACAPIRDALSKLPPLGGEVVIPDGTYVCDSPIILNRDFVTLRGLGNATLRLADKANSPQIIMGNTETPPALVHDIHVVNLKLEGNRHHQQMECWGGPCDAGGLANIRNNGIS